MTMQFRANNARMFQLPIAVDRTNYGLTRRSTRSYELHHKQRISLAAVMADAKAIRSRRLLWL